MSNTSKLVRAVLFVLCAATAAAITWPALSCADGFYVAPDGNDSFSGSIDNPFATLERARDAARKIPPGQSKRIVVRGGKYYNVSLVLGPEDSGLTIQAANGENPVLYGGQLLENWQKDGSQFYAASLPPFPALEQDQAHKSHDSKWGIRMLLVDNEMRPRSRFPASGALTHEISFDVPWMSSTGGGWQRKPTAEELTTIEYRADDLGSWLETGNAEITVYHMWDESCVGIAAIDTESKTLRLASPLGHPPGAFGIKKYVIWNIREGMTSPGQWRHDRVQGRIIYWPMPGQDMRNAEVVVPAYTIILRLEGRPDSRIKNISIRGLAFSVTTAPLVAAGFAASRFDGAISLAHTENCVLSDLTVKNVAGHGINTRSGEHIGLRIENCEVANCGAGGIYAGGQKTLINNNHVHGIGLNYPSAIGIFRGGKENIVKNNEVHNCSYSAINYGGESNIIERNEIYDCMKALHDGAAIYMFAAKNCSIRQNFAHDIVDTGGYGASAYYLDERSNNCVVEENLSVRVAWPSHNHMATNNIIRNNVFIVNGNAKLTFPRSTEFQIEGNVIYATGKIRIENSGAISRWAKNIFYSQQDVIEQVQMRSYSSIDTSKGAPGDTITADPLFRDMANGDFSYLPASPALRLGMKPIDISKTGRISR